MKSEKQQARAKARDLRSGISADERREQAFIVARGGLAFLEGVSRETIVSGYYPVRDEFDCLPLLQILTTLGVATCLPVVDEQTGLLNFRQWAAGDKTEKGAFDIPAPLDDAVPLNPSVLLLPMLAFDMDGNRLGYGGGHFDRTLEQLRASGSVQAVGLAFNEQQAEALPVEPHDQKLDWVLTASGSHKFGG